MVRDKQEMIGRLGADGDTVAIIDYTLFDLSSIEELEILAMRFDKAHFIIFSDELGAAFITRASHIPNCSIVMKGSPLRDITAAIANAAASRQYICPEIDTLLHNHRDELQRPATPLTATEIEILKLIASGLSNKDIAARRFSSYHTITTHRKNIFRKLGINTAFEAQRYARRAGYISDAEYSI